MSAASCLAERNGSSSIGAMPPAGVPLSPTRREYTRTATASWRGQAPMRNDFPSLTPIRAVSWPGGFRSEVASRAFLPPLYSPAASPARAGTTGLPEGPIRRVEGPRCSGLRCEVETSALGDVKVDPLDDVDPLIGRAVRERYRLFQKLGGGRSDNVYLAEELITGNKVAVRVFPREFVCDPALLKQCWSEARFATASDPASIVRVYEVDRTDEGRVFIAMEYLEGESLSEVLRRGGALEPGHAVRLASDIAHALASASKVGVSHGRLEPRNIVLVAPDQRVKVTGFGVARLRGAIAGDRLIGLGLVAPEYIAPEQMKDGAAAEATDVYALGAVLYTMLTGSAPVTAPRHGDAQANDPRAAPAAVRTLRP